VCRLRPAGIDQCMSRHDVAFAHPSSFGRSSGSVPSEVVAQSGRRAFACNEPLVLLHHVIDGSRFGEMCRRITHVSVASNRRACRRAACNTSDGAAKCACNSPATGDHRVAPEAPGGLIPAVRQEPDPDEPGRCRRAERGSSASAGRLRVPSDSGKASAPRRTAPEHLTVGRHVGVHRRRAPRLAYRLRENLRSTRDSLRKLSRNRARSGSHSFPVIVSIAAHGT
jgi:hypothetical protein